MQKFLVKLVPVILVLFLLALPAAAQTDPVAMIEDFFDSTEGLLRTIAGSAAVIGLLGLAIINMGTVFPPVAAWKQENPKMSQNILYGLGLLVFVGSGAYLIFAV